MTQVKTAVTIREDLFEQANTVANEIHLSRSGLFELALEQFLSRYQNRRLLEQINEAYASPQTEEEKESLAIMRSHEGARSSGSEW